MGRWEDGRKERSLLGGGVGWMRIGIGIGIGDEKD